MLSQFYEIWQRLPNNKKIIILSGEGLSLQSGIPLKDDAHASDFWGKTNFKEFLNVDNLTIQPDKLWDWVEDKKTKLNKIIPNKSHYALVELERLFKENFCLITETVDNLHNEAGNSRVIEIKGNLFLEKKLESIEFLPDVHLSDIPINQYGDFMRPDILLEGEELEKTKQLKCQSLAQQCDLIIITGSNLDLSLTSKLPLIAKKYNEAKIIEINADKQYCAQTDLFLKTQVEKILPFLIHTIIDFELNNKNMA